MHWLLLPFVGRVKNRDRILLLPVVVCSFLLSLSLSHFLNQNPNPFTSQSNHGRWFFLDCSSLFRIQTLSSRSSISIRSVFFFSFVFAFPQFLKPNFKFLKFFSFVDTTSSVRTYHGVILISDCGFFDYILRIDLKLNTSREKIAMLVDYVWKLFSAVN